MSKQETTSFGNQQVPISEKQDLVDGVFHKVADRYDLMNDLMSGGVHRIWKDIMVTRLAAPRSGKRPFQILDMAGGTGDIAFRIAKSTFQYADITVCDINAEMLAVGRQRAKQLGLDQNVQFEQENAEQLPYEDNSFDAYTIAFGIRNVPRRECALREAHRILKPGGRFLCLEFSQVDVPILDKLYDLFSFNLIPPMGRAVTGSSEPYQYFVESIRQFPAPVPFENEIKAAGFKRVSHDKLSGGIVALHSGWKI